MSGQNVSFWDHLDVLRAVLLKTVDSELFQYLT